MNSPRDQASATDAASGSGVDDPALAQGLARGPLVFDRICLEKVWGGRALEEVLGIELPGGGPDPRPIGETWELVDRADHQSVVRSGELAGRTLGELVRDAPRALLGDARPAPNGRFPLLVKFLDASANLSVQVHPDEAGAAAQGAGSEPKTEAWYFLRDGGAVWCGFDAGVDRARFEAALASGAPADLLAHHPVRGGEALTVPGGTVHAIGAGVTLLEVQQNSDTTYRLDDWGRLGLDGRPRELHVRPGLEVTRFDAPAPRPRAAGEPGARHGGDPSGDSSGHPAEGERRAAGVERLVDTAFFRLETLDLAPGAAGTFDTAGESGRAFQILVLVEGSGIVLRPDRDGAAPTTLATGDLALVPAALGRFRVEREPTSEGPARCVCLACPLDRR